MSSAAGLPDGRPVPTAERPLVLLRPHPAPLERLFGSDALALLHDRFTVVELDAGDRVVGYPELGLDDVLPETFAIVGQPDLTADRLHRAPALRAVLNTEGNFYPNVDYPGCFRNGVRVLGCGPAYADAVAEYALGLALDLARGISREDRAFRAGQERYLGAGNADAVLLRHSNVGLIGYGNLGRALRPLLAPFGPTIRVYDPWLPPSVLRADALIPASLSQLLAQSQFVFVLAAVTSENEQLIGGAELDLLAPGARLIVISRAAVVDYPAMVQRVAAGRFLAAVDVWPAEPVAADDPVRSIEGFVLSAHRAGGIPAASLQIGEMVVDDLSLIKAGLPPARMQQAAPELVGRYRNRPAGR